MVSTVGAPPESRDALQAGRRASVAKIMLPSGPHVAPRGGAVDGLIVAGGPPVIATFLIVFPSKKPTHCPSGEMKTPRGAPRPLRTLGSSWSSARTSS